MPQSQEKRKHCFRQWYIKSNAVKCHGFKKALEDAKPAEGGPNKRRRRATSKITVHNTGETLPGTTPEKAAFETVTSDAVSEHMSETTAAAEAERLEKERQAKLKKERQEQAALEAQAVAATTAEAETMAESGAMAKTATEANPNATTRNTTGGSGGSVKERALMKITGFLSLSESATQSGNGASGSPGCGEEQLPSLEHLGEGQLSSLIKFQAWCRGFLLRKKYAQLMADIGPNLLTVKSGNANCQRFVTHPSMLKRLSSPGTYETENGLCFEEGGPVVLSSAWSLVKGLRKTGSSNGMLATGPSQRGPIYEVGGKIVLDCFGRQLQKGWDMAVLVAPNETMNVSDSETNSVTFTGDTKSFELVRVSPATDMTFTACC